MSKQNQEPPAEGEDELGKLFEAMGEASREEDVERVQELAPQMWAALAQQIKGKPESPWLREWKIAHEREAAFDWRGAEAAFKRAIKAEEAGSAPISRGYGHLAQFYGFVGRDDEAFQLALEITERARRYEGWVLSMQLTQALQYEASWHLKRGDALTARGLVEESLPLAAGEAHLEMMVRLGRLALAECDTEIGDLDRAERGLEELWPQLEPWQDAGMMAGEQMVLALWWRARAHLCEKREQDEAAIEAWRQSVHFRRVIAQAPQLEGPYKFNALALALRSLGRALERAGQPLAAHALAESRSLRRSIGLAEIES